MSITSSVGITRKIMVCLNQLQKERALHDDIADDSTERDACVILIVSLVSPPSTFLDRQCEISVSANYSGGSHHS